MRDFDIPLMKRAIELAERGAGAVSPNPLVGCVMADKSGKILSEGYHQWAGSLHAEINALIRLPKGQSPDSLYVTLEPCVGPYEGKKTPPCVPALARLGLKRAIVGMLDPNPQVQGLGARALQNLGLEVSVGTLEHQCRILNRIYLQRKRPYIHLKAAITLDGRICDAYGNSQWITDHRARSWAHELRARHDAVAVGANTVLQDHPSLDIRLAPVKRFPKWRVAIVRHEKVSKESNLFQNQGKFPSIFLAPKGGVSFEETFFQALEERGIRSILVEGGSKLLSFFLAHGLYDELTLFVAPKLLGGGKNFFEKIQAASMENIKALKLISEKSIGDQRMVTYQCLQD